MVSQPQAPSIRSFIFVLFRLLKDGEKERCSCIETAIGTGVATYLFSKYQHAFEDVQFAEKNLVYIDAYFKSTWAGCADGEEFRKYDCKESEGLWLLFSLIIENVKL